jgi:DNA gyrase, B subunit
MPEIIQEGRLYSACPPLYRVIQGKKITYFDTDNDKDKYVKELKDKGITNFMVTRFKGLTITSPEKQQCFGIIHFYTGRSLGYQSVA